MLEGVFWTGPSDADDSRPTDPLGLDAAREELADRLVPCLTGRTRSHDNFFWTLVLVRWSQDEGGSDEDRVRRFLSWERCLKLHWARDRGRRDSGFPGVSQAREQGDASGAPSTRYTPLLKNQRAQGLLGAHLGPLRKLGLVSDSSITLETDGDALIAGVGSAPKLKDGSWGTWTTGFARPYKAFDARFRRRLRGRLEERMPNLYAALHASHWRQGMAWRIASKTIGSALKPYARLADAYCPWADQLRVLFHRLVQAAPDATCPLLPLRLDIPIPKSLSRWSHLRVGLGKWQRTHAERVLADLHERVFSDRGYTNDLWLRLEDGKRITFPSRASANVALERGDCRWYNAVLLMRPE